MSDGGIKQRLSLYKRTRLRFGTSDVDKGITALWQHTRTPAFCSFQWSSLVCIVLLVSMLRLTFRTLQRALNIHAGTCSVTSSQSNSHSDGLLPSHSSRYAICQTSDRRDVWWKRTASTYSEWAGHRAVLREQERERERDREGGRGRERWDRGLSSVVDGSASEENEYGDWMALRWKLEKGIELSRNTATMYICKPISSQTYH